MEKDHFKSAVWLGAAFSAIGIVAAATLPRRVSEPETAAETAAEQLQLVAN